jgi:hypothetical protein
MRRRLHPIEIAFHLAPFIVLALIAATGAGCSAIAPTQQSYAVRLTFNGAGHEMIDLRKAGQFPDPAYGNFADAMNALAPQLDLLDSAAAEAESAGSADIAAHYRFSNLLKSVNAYINQLTAQLLAQRNAKHAPATQPGAN